MEIVITAFVIIIFGYFLIGYLNRPHVYIQKLSENIMQFLYVLLYRGSYMGMLMIYDSEFEKSIFFSKNKYKGKILINLHFPIYKEFAESETVLTQLLEKQELDYFFEEVEDFKILKTVTIYLNKDIAIANYICRSLLNEMFKIKMTSSIHLYYREVNYDPDVVIGFKEIPNDIKEKFDVGIPITNFGYISNKIGFFFGRMFRGFFK